MYKAQAPANICVTAGFFSVIGHANRAMVYT